LTDCDGEPFLFPNDLAFGPDGALYMTDSGMRWPEWEARRADYKRLQLDGRVYRIDTTSLTVRKIDWGLPFANGVAFGPDKCLYVNATVSGLIYRYEWKDGKLGNRETFGDVVDHELPEGYRGPDGMKFAANGDLYVAVVWQQDVTVLGADGKVKRRIPMEGDKPTNLAFGPPGSQRIYVTERATGQLLVHDVGVDGHPLYS
jgi:gluconolactonase